MPHIANKWFSPPYECTFTIIQKQTLEAPKCSARLHKINGKHNKLSEKVRSPSYTSNTPHLMYKKKTTPLRYPMHGISTATAISDHKTIDKLCSKAQFLSTPLQCRAKKGVGNQSQTNIPLTLKSQPYCDISTPYAPVLSESTSK